MSDPREPANDRPGPGSELVPIDVDGVTAVGVGTAIWAVLVLVGLVLRSWLQENGRGWWLWVAVAGFLLGLAGLAFVIRRRNAYRSAAGASPGSATTSS